jgi:hypothetical protein
LYCAVLQAYLTVANVPAHSLKQSNTGPLENLWGFLIVINLTFKQSGYQRTVLKFFGMGDRPPRQGAAGRMIAAQQGGGQARGDLYDKITIERSISAYKYEKEIGSLAVWRVSSAKPGNGMFGKY